MMTKGTTNGMTKNTRRRELYHSDNHRTRKEKLEREADLQNEISNPTADFVSVSTFPQQLLSSIASRQAWAKTTVIHYSVASEETAIQISKQKNQWNAQNADRRRGSFDVDNRNRRSHGGSQRLQCLSRWWTMNQKEIADAPAHIDEEKTTRTALEEWQELAHRKQTDQEENYEWDEEREVRVLGEKELKCKE